MTQQDSGPAAFNPKHRIIGAIILVALAVIFIPMLLDETQPPSDLKETPEIPARPATSDTKVVITPVTKPEPKDQVEVAPPPPKPAIETAKTESKEAAEPLGVEPLKPTEAKAPGPSPTETPAAKPAPAPKTEKAEKAEKTEKAGSKGWIVQVGVYANPDNAARASSKLKSHGHAVREEHIKIATGTAVRLRVGPYRDKAIAQRARDQIEKDIGEKAVVLPYP
ncbi:MAG: SPOR domain-containing protein [Pseudomonadota bacterium]|nr:MAG: SPOR domain-containing protein [Pseudomonadota bacterium]